MIKYSLIIAGIGLLVAICLYLWAALPIISGYGTKNMCSGIFVAGHAKEDLLNEELAFFPISAGKYIIDREKGSVTGSVLGIAVNKAIYRPGLGCTLISDVKEEELRSQHFVLAESPPVNPDTIDWPMGDRINTASLQTVDLEKLHRAVDSAFIETDVAHPARTRAVIVLRKGNIIAERYAAGFDRHSRLIGWSMAKSLTGAMIGILVRKGLLDPDARAPVPGWDNPSDPRHFITLKQLLQQTSGLDFTEKYDRPSEVTNMLFKKGDMAAYAESLKLRHEPGSVFNYSSGNSNILSGIIRRTVNENEYHRFPHTELFYPLGMYNMILEPDASGTFVGSSYAYATARDWARFGLLYQQNGMWNGRQLLPEGWVDQTRAPGNATTPGAYGYQFWLNTPQGPLHMRKFPDAPAEMFYADGYQGQYIFIIPSKEMVIVRLGLTQGEHFDANTFLKRIINSVDS